MFIAVSSYDIHGYLLVALVLAIPVLFIVIPWTVRGEDRFLIQWLVLALVLKMGASGFRMIWGFIVKDGRIDAGRYDSTGRVLAEAIWNRDFDTVVPFLTKPGTSFVEGFTGVLYSIIGPTLFGGFLFFALLVFIASCIYYRAFRIAFPTGNRIIFFVLIFFYPSWLYWPSSIGKDAFVALWFSLAVYGTAILLRRNDLRGLIVIAIGLWGAFMIRPHVAALMLIGLGIVMTFRSYKLGLLTPVVRIAVVTVLVILGLNLIGGVASYVRLDEVSLDAALVQYEAFQENASGGASFTPVSLYHPLGVPQAIVTILYRPFPWEAHRMAALALALESSSLLGLTIVRFGSIRAAIASARSDPFVLFILVYIVLCILAFTSFGNFSIVGRQRLQFLPLFFMLLAYPFAARGKKKVTPASKVAADKDSTLPAGGPILGGGLGTRDGS